MGFKVYNVGINNIKFDMVKTFGDVTVFLGDYDDDVYAYDIDGNLLYTYDTFTSNIFYIVESASSDVYTADSDTIHKSNPTKTGSDPFIQSFSGNGYVMDIDTMGNFYVASSDSTVKKIDSDDNVIWTYSHSGQAFSVCVNPDGYAFSTDAFDNTFVKHDLDGTKLWEFTLPTDTVRTVACDEYGFSYCGGRDNTLRKVDSDGNQVWATSEQTGGSIENICVDSDGNVYVATYGDAIVKYDSNGNYIWDFRPGVTNFNRVSVDRASNVYGTSNNSQKLFAISKDGVEKWNKDFQARAVYSTGRNPCIR